MTEILNSYLQLCWPKFMIIQITRAWCDISICCQMAKNIGSCGPVLLEGLQFVYQDLSNVLNNQRIDVLAVLGPTSYF